MRELKLGDIADIITGPFGSQLHMEDYVNEGIPVVMPQNIKERKVDEKDIARISEYDYVRLKKYATMKNDMVYARRGDIEKHAFIENDNEMLCGTGCLRIRVKDSDVLPLYLSFYLCSPEARKGVVSHAIGTNMQNLNTGILSEVPVKLPSYEKQAIIADFLHKLEHKIELNQKINDYLEEMAKALYDYWFVQFDFPDKKGKPYKSSGGALLYNEVLKKEIPFGWTIDTLGNLLSKVPNSTKIPATDFCDKGSIPVIDQSSDFIAGYTDDETSILSNKTGYIVFGDHTRVVKYIRFPFARGADGTQVINSNNRCMPNELFYQVIKSIDLSNYGYARHFKYLKDTIIAIPSANLADIYAEKVGKWYENQVSIMKENIALSQLRDWLLPMLMNGQATIEN